MRFLVRFPLIAAHYGTDKKWMVIDLASKRSTAHIVVSASSLTAFSSLTASIYLQILDNMGRSEKIQIATAAETARLRTVQEKDARRAKTAAGQQSSSREMRREIDDAQTGGRKKAAHKSRGGGHSPAEAGRGSAKRPLDFEEEEAQPRRRISGGTTRPACVRPEW